MLLNRLILYHLLILLSIFPSISVFFNESAVCIWWPKHWSFSISPSSEYSGLISFRIDWFLSPCCPRSSQEFSPAPQFKSQFFGTQTSLRSNSHIYTWLLKKPELLLIQTFVSKVMSLLLNTLSRFVIAFLPGSKCLLLAITIQGDFRAQEKKQCPTPQIRQWPTIFKHHSGTKEALK